MPTELTAHPAANALHPRPASGLFHVVRAFRGQLALALALGSATLHAAPPTTLMVEPTERILFEDFSAPELPPRWMTPKGQWKPKDGVLKGLEIEAQKYTGNVRTKADFGRTFVIRSRFKLAGALRTAMAFDGPNGHICRVTIEAHGFSVQKDASATDPKDPVRQLDTAAYPFTKNEWHTLTVEFDGDTVIAWVDDKHFVTGSDPKLDQDKVQVAMSLRGVEAKDEALLIDEVEAWRAKPRADWSERKTKLLAQHAPKPSPPVNGPDHYKNAQAQKAKKASPAK